MTHRGRGSRGGKGKSHLVDFDASKPEDGAVRRKAVGVIEGRLFAVLYTERDDVVRIISARRCNAAEARRYGPVHS